VWIRGAFALEQGFILTSTILAAATVQVIERRFRRAGAWMLLGAAASAAGLVHSYRYTRGDTAILLAPAWAWATGYLAAAILFFLAPALTEPGEGHG
jgi:adenine/guanine/hypoxanthine permease